VRVACSFAELSKVLEPGKAAKTDKSSIITDAIRIVTQLRAENGQLRQLNKFLEVCILPNSHPFNSVPQRSLHA